MISITTIEITPENLPTVIAEHDIVILDFWAAWCKPCHAFAPVFERAAEENPDVAFGRVDTDAQQDLARAFRVTSLPTLVGIVKGGNVYAHAGVMNAPQLRAVIEAVRRLDEGTGSAERLA